MKKILCVSLAVLVLSFPCARAADDMQSQMLAAEITRLEKEIKAESAKLEDCAKKTKNFKIAGGVLLGVTAVGVAVNVALAMKIKKLKAGSGQLAPGS